METKREGFFGTDNLHRAGWAALIGLSGFLGVLAYQQVFGPQKVVVETNAASEPQTKSTPITAKTSEQLGSPLLQRDGPLKAQQSVKWQAATVTHKESLSAPVVNKPQKEAIPEAVIAPTGYQPKVWQVEVTVTDEMFTEVVMPPGVRFSVYCAGEGLEKVFWRNGPQDGLIQRCGTGVGENLIVDPDFRTVN